MKINILTTQNNTGTQNHISFQAVNKFLGAEKDLDAVVQHFESIANVRKLIRHKNNYTQLTLSDYSLSKQPRFLRDLLVIDYKKPKKGKISEKIKIILSEKDAVTLSEDVSVLRSQSRPFSSSMTDKAKKEWKKQVVQEFWQAVNSFIERNLNISDHYFDAKKILAEMQEDTFDYKRFI